MIDDIGRTAVDDLRRSVTEDLFPEDMLRRLHETRRRRNFAAAGSAGLVTILLVAVTALGTGLRGDALSTPPAGPGTPTASPQDDDSALPREACEAARITCLGDRRVRVDLPVPVVLEVPESFLGRMQLWGATAVEDYRTDVGTVGVTILERARPVRYDDSWETDRTAGTTARSVARWLADRPFFSGAVTSRITVGGLPSWRVAPTVRGGARMPVIKGEAAAPTFAGDEVSIGSSPTLDGEYVVLDVPGAGLTVIWTWSYSRGPAVLAESRSYVDALRFLTD